MTRFLSLALSLVLAASTWAAGEIQLGGLSTGATYYVVVFNQAGNALTTGTTFATYTTTRGDFDQVMSEPAAGTGRFNFDFPAVAAGSYTWEIYEQAGGSPAHSDLQVGAGGGWWSGTAFGADVRGAGGTATTSAGGRLEVNASHLDGAELNPANSDAMRTAFVEFFSGISGLVETSHEVIVDGTNGLAAIRTKLNSTASGLVDTTAATITSQTVLTLTAGSSADGAYAEQIVILSDASNSDAPCVRKCTAYVGATRTVTIDSAPNFTIETGDGVRILPNSKLPAPKEITIQVGQQ